MILGVDYYPEHWPSNMLEADIERIVSLGANTVRIGEFAWHLMEPSEGDFDFSFFDNVITTLKKHGLKVIFGTPTATFPAWIAKMYPDVIAMNEHGVRHAFGGRRLYCYNSPEYNALAERMVDRLMNHYKDENAIVAWQIDNELGHEGSDQCYCPNCEAGFRKFLKDRYQTIRTLNETYGTIFWGQTYNDFDEIPMPRPTITTHNPTLLVDWARFRSYSINTFAAKQIDIVKKYLREDQQVTHNLFGGFFDRAYNQNVLADNLDVVSYDNYPVWGGLETPLSPSHIAMTHDYIRGLKQKNFWIVEELMGAQGHTVIGYLPRPNQAKLWSYQAMARGCESLLYFRYRGMTKGAEQFCQGILDSDNKINDKFLEVQSFFKEVSTEEALFKSSIKADVALLYDYDNRWSWAAQPQSHAFDFTDEFVRLHAGFHNLNVMTDVIDINRDFSSYKVVVLPSMQIVDESLLNRLKVFSQSGGTVVFGFRSGIKDRDNNLRLEENILNQYCGIELGLYESLGKSQEVDIKGLNGERGTVKVWRDLIKVESAQQLYGYDDAFYKEYAAVTVHKYGKGDVYYLGGGLCSETIDALTRRICEAQKIELMASPDGLEIIKRGTKVIVLNHTDKTVDYNEHVLKPYEAKILEAVE